MLELTTVWISTICEQTYTGFFAYDTVEGASLPAVAPNFGLRSNTTWSNLTRTLFQLNAQGALTDGSSYKLIFAGRHGQGYHNVAEKQYGTPAWDSYWSELTTDGNITWGPDARLTPLGVQQAQAVNDAWVAMLKQSDSAPLPTRLFSSPLSRALSTLETSYDNILVHNPNNTATHPAGLPVLPVPRSSGWQRSRRTHQRPYRRQTTRRNARGQRALPRRVRRTHLRPASYRSQLQKDYPNVRFEPGFAEQDTLWTTTREQDSHLDARIQQALTQMWNEAKPDQVVSLTSHSGVMQSVFRVVGIIRSSRRRAR